MINQDYKPINHRKGPRDGYTSMACRHCRATIPIERIRHFKHRKWCKLYEEPKRNEAVDPSGVPTRPQPPAQKVDKGRNPKKGGWKPSGAAEAVVVETET